MASFTAPAPPPLVVVVVVVAEVLDDELFVNTRLMTTTTATITTTTAVIDLLDDILEILSLDCLDTRGRDGTPLVTRRGAPTRSVARNGGRTMRTKAICG
ncbi:MAG: hypothetical protein HIU57_02090, partial [Acidobacteria bacterium]|nr:hypothetical protein [Acidobacteriota bacterium]